MANYQRTICGIRERDYLLRRINAIPEPIVQEAERARSAMITAAEALIQALHWADFEVMVDLIFARGGWQRRSVLGGSMADVDLILVQPTIGTTASVQIKSKASQRELQRHIDHFRRSGGHERTFFICHSPSGLLSSPTDPTIHLWTGAALAEAAVKAGLLDWLMEKAA